MTSPTGGIEIEELDKKLIAVCRSGADRAEGLRGR
jgi:hypothetical protein